MDSIWTPALLVLGLGLAWARLDAWWTHRRWRLDRERRRDALPPSGAATAAATGPTIGPTAGPAAGAAAGVGGAAPTPTPSMAADAADAAFPGRPAPGRPRAEASRESDQPA